MSISDYLDRTVDVMAYQGVVPSGEALLSPDLITADNGGMVCTGTQKLAQRFLLELLTEKGSIPYQEDRGCEFITDARNGVFRTAADVLASFSAALLDIENNLLEEEADDEPDDEKYASAEVLSVSLATNVAAVTVRVTSVAGSSRKVILPIHVVVS